MPKILRDADIRKLLGSVIKDGDPSCIRPNSYILRLGEEGEFLSTEKLYTLGGKKLGIKLQPGHSVGMTAHETIDFRADIVAQIFPDAALHGFLSPTTDLAREGVVTPTGQVDAGYFGTLNWTVTNTSAEERRFQWKERLMRLTIFLLTGDEIPETPYTGDYQEKRGYVRSQRKGAPTGMRSEQWEDSNKDGGPEEILESLIKSGYPWNSLGKQLKKVGDEIQTVTNEYSAIRDSIDRVEGDIHSIKASAVEAASKLPATIKEILQADATSLQNRWIIVTGSGLLGLLGIAVAVSNSARALKFLADYGTIIGLAAILVAATLILLAMRKR